MKVTLVPAQMVPAGLAEMLLLTGLIGFTVMVMALEVAGLPVGQVMLELSTQVTTEPFVRVVVV